MDRNGYSAGYAAYPRGVDASGRPVFIDERGFAIIGMRQQPKKTVGGVTQMPSLSGIRGRMGNNDDGKRTIRGVNEEQAASIEADDKERRADEREPRPGGADNAAAKDRAAKAAEAEQANKGGPPPNTREGARRPRAAREQEEMGGPANQEMPQTGRTPMQDGTISTTEGRMASKKGRVVGSSKFFDRAKRRR